MEASIVLCTVPTDEHARKIARALVEERLAACVSILPGVRSIYRWQSNICEDPELILLIKTRKEAFNRLFHRIQELHPYEVPEILSLEVGSSSPAFLSWLQGATDVHEHR